MSRPEFDASVIATHAAGLRALALAILRDRDAADEVVQETWARALVAPAPRGDGLGGWLRVVARGLALNRLRDDGQRRHRESTAVRERQQDAREEDERRAETLRVVVDAVLALDESYRRIVLLRYFDGYEPTEIAARLGVPVATVATRLKRAKERLRERLAPKLEREDGGLRGALALLAGLDPRTVGDGAAASFALQHVKKLALAALLLVGVGVAWWMMQPPRAREDGRASEGLAALAGERAPAEVASLRAGDRGTDAESAALAAEDDEHGDRTSLASAPRASRARGPSSSAPRIVERGPYLHHLVVEALDRDLHPLPGALVLGAPSRGTLNELGTTDWRGRFELEWRAFEPVCELELVVRGDDGGSSPLVRVEVAHDVTRVARLAVELPQVSARGTRREVASSATTPKERPTRRSKARRDADESSARLANPIAVPRFTLDPHSNGIFAEPLLLMELRSGPARAVERAEAAEQPTRAKYLTVRVGSGPEELRELRSKHAKTRFVEFDLALVDESGAAVPDVVVSIASESGRIVARSDRNGRVQLPFPWHGLVQLAVGSGPWTVVKEELELDPRATSFLRKLRRGENMQMVLTGATGQVKRDWVVEAWSTRAAAQLVAQTRTDAEGHAVLCLPQGGPWKLLARQEPAAGDIAELVHEAAWPTSGVETFALSDPALSTGKMKVSFAAATGERLSKSEARLWDRRSGHGLVLGSQPIGTGVENEVERVFESPLLRGAIYVLEGGGPGQRWSSFGEVRVPAGKALDLGRVPFPDHALLAIDSSVLPAGTKATLEVTSHRGGALVRGPEFGVELPVKFAAAPGAYTITVRYSMPGAGEDANPETRLDEYDLELAPGHPGSIDLGAPYEHPTDPRAPAANGTPPSGPR